MIIKNDAGGLTIRQNNEIDNSFYGSLIANEPWELFEITSAEAFGIYHAMAFIESNRTQSFMHRPSDVTLKIERAENDDAVLEKVAGDVVAVQNQPGSQACHIIAKSREQTMAMFEKLNGLGMNVDWITSEKDKDGQCNVMRRWANSEIRVLVSTIQDGIDNPKNIHPVIQFLKSRFIGGNIRTW